MKKGTQHISSSRLRTAESMQGKRNAVGNKGGRPGGYKPEYAKQVHNICLLGAIDSEIAFFFDISVRTLNYWKKRYPDFREAMWRGKIIADAEVAEALFRLACGYTYTETQVWLLKDANGERVIRHIEVEKHLPPNVRACQFWLTNRQPHKWSFKPTPPVARAQNVLIRREEVSGEIVVETRPDNEGQWLDELEQYVAQRASQEQSTSA
ncbi:terminase [Spirosoma sp. RP8]|uniref:Terminase n=1 Tax=Spirosoma liriopis TaxID=2937440 RepID=A0ABT0HF10_9BACT|nr:terminase [Spirosoma liriopis]MCK8490746.1 terminase [Spirosoma liriopis]